MGPVFSPHGGGEALDVGERLDHRPPQEEVQAEDEERIEGDDPEDDRLAHPAQVLIEEAGRPIDPQGSRSSPH
jgi:hypothetical protein